MQFAQSHVVSPGRLLRLATVAGVVLVASACGARAPSPHADVRTARITEEDFRIKAPKVLPAGETRLSVANKGPDDHELIVLRARGSRLPLRADGLTVDEDALESVTLGTLEPGEPHTVRELRVTLAPGRYELLCNMAGHFFGGMHAALVVR